MDQHLYQRTIVQQDENDNDNQLTPLLKKQI